MSHGQSPAKTAEIVQSNVSSTAAAEPLLHAAQRFSSLAKPIGEPYQYCPTLSFALIVIPA